MRWPCLIDLCRALQCRKRELLRVIFQVRVTPDKSVGFVTDPDLEGKRARDRERERRKEREGGIKETNN